jgi:hypothetical protein
VEPHLEYLPGYIWSGANVPSIVGKKPTPLWLQRGGLCPTIAIRKNGTAMQIQETRMGAVYHVLNGLPKENDDIDNKMLNTIPKMAACDEYNDFACDYYKKWVSWHKSHEKAVEVLSPLRGNE